MTTPFDIYTTYLPDIVFREFTLAISMGGVLPHSVLAAADAIEDSIYTAIGIDV